MPHALFVVAPERFRDEELAVPRQALVNAGCRATVVSTRTGTARGTLGAREPVARSVRAVQADGFDAVVVVGGPGSPDHLWSHEPLLELCRRQAASGQVLSAICLSGAVLARAGVLFGRRATVYPSARALLELKRAGAVYVEDPVVQDGMLITASGPAAAGAFGAALTTLLGL